MLDFQLLSPSEQVADHLKNLLGQGRWTGLMPGAGVLAKDLPGVDRKAIGAALKQLVQEGWLEDRGVGKRRKILQREKAKKLFRIGYLPYIHDGDNRLEGRIHSTLSKKKGIHLENAPKAVVDLDRDLAQITKMVESLDMDAWIVPAGSKEILEWFHLSGLPVYAVFGRHLSLPIDGFYFDVGEGILTLADRLLQLGHRRICYITRKERRLPKLGALENMFFEKLAKAGIHPNSFTLPDWDETPQGYRNLLDSLFRLTPPTALILPETYLVHSAFQYFSEKGLQVPRDVSLVCMEDCEDFQWSIPRIACIQKDFDQPCKAAVDWIEIIRSGKPCPRKKTRVPSRFFEGETLVQ